MGGLTVWRHPKPVGVAGRCIGHTDVPADRRKSKRLAHRIRAWARRHGAAHVVITSPLRRGADVGRWLVRWGWCHRIDGRLIEVDFGHWDGRAWDAIDAASVDTWCRDFAQHRPGDGEPVVALLARCAAFIAEVHRDSVHRDSGAEAWVCVVGHAGWISAALWLQRAGPVLPEAGSWPAAVGYGARVLIGGADVPGVSGMPAG